MVVGGATHEGRDAWVETDDVREAPARRVGDMKVGEPRQAPKVVGVS